MNSNKVVIPQNIFLATPLTYTLTDKKHSPYKTFRFFKPMIWFRSYCNIFFCERLFFRLNTERNRNVCFLVKICNILSGTNQETEGLSGTNFGSPIIFVKIRTKTLVGFMNTKNTKPNLTKKKMFTLNCSPYLQSPPIPCGLVRFCTLYRSELHFELNCSSNILFLELSVYLYYMR